MIDVNSIYNKYNTSEQGLKSLEAQKRLEENGRNVFPVGKQKNMFLILVKV